MCKFSPTAAADPSRPQRSYTTNFVQGRTTGLKVSRYHSTGTSHLLVFTGASVSTCNPATLLNANTVVARFGLEYRPDVVRGAAAGVVAGQQEGSQPAGLHGGGWPAFLLGDQQNAQCFAVAISARHRQTAGVHAQRRQRRQMGVDGVGLAPPAALGSTGLRGLDHRFTQRGRGRMDLSVGIPRRPAGSTWRRRHRYTADEQSL
jgi:hypothetical protein